MRPEATHGARHLPRCDEAGRDLRSVPCLHRLQLQKHSLAFGIHHSSLQTSRRLFSRNSPTQLLSGRPNALDRQVQQQVSWVHAGVAQGRFRLRRFQTRHAAR
jgi:hypothetical protein